LKVAIEEVAGPALKVDFKKLAEEAEDDVEVIRGKYKPSCDLSGSLLGVVYLAYKLVVIWKRQCLLMRIWEGIIVIEGRRWGRCWVQSNL